MFDAHPQFDSFDHELHKLFQVQRKRRRKKKHRTTIEIHLCYQFLNVGRNEFKQVFEDQHGMCVIFTKRQKKNANYVETPNILYQYQVQGNPCALTKLVQNVCR